MAILHVVEATNAGVGRHVLDLVEGQVAAGHVVDVAFGTHRADDEFLGRLAASGARRTLPLDIGRNPQLGDLRCQLVLRRFAREAGPYDVVHGHASKGGVHARVLPRRGARSVYTPNALVTMDPTLRRSRRVLFGAIEKMLSRRTDAVIYVSPEERDHGVELGLRPRRAELVPNGIPFVDLPDRPVARAELDLDDDVVVVGFVGRFSQQKGLDRLVDAVPLIAASTRWQVAIVGDGDEGELGARAVGHGADDAIVWLGRRPGQRAMAAFDLLVVPSRYEGFPYVVLEGLWAGLPVVATTGACASQVLADGSVGVLSEPEPAALAAAIGALIDDPRRRAAMSAAAATVALSYGVEEMVERTGAVYRAALSA